MKLNALPGALALACAASCAPMSPALAQSPFPSSSPRADGVNVSTTPAAICWGSTPVTVKCLGDNLGLPLAGNALFPDAAAQAVASSAAWYGPIHATPNSATQYGATFRANVSGGQGFLQGCADAACSNPVTVAATVTMSGLVVYDVKTPNGVRFPFHRSTFLNGATAETGLLVASSFLAN